mmetsp:Transcript_75852/g.183340  ORF Transcript_75852/g.183340 Transcript_75852/m.183340 type:complete len:317 (-) Transcript_75852:1240-2190(-)
MSGGFKTPNRPRMPHVQARSETRSVPTKDLRAHPIPAHQSTVLPADLRDGLVAFPGNACKWPCDCSDDGDVKRSIAISQVREGAFVEVREGASLLVRLLVALEIPSRKPCGEYFGQVLSLLCRHLCGCREGSKVPVNATKKTLEFTGVQLHVAINVHLLKLLLNGGLSLCQGLRGSTRLDHVLCGCSQLSSPFEHVLHCQSDRVRLDLVRLRVKVLRVLRELGIDVCLLLEEGLHLVHAECAAAVHVSLGEQLLGNPRDALQLHRGGVAQGEDGAEAALDLEPLVGDDAQVVLLQRFQVKLRLVTVHLGDRLLQLH